MVIDSRGNTVLFCIFAKCMLEIDSSCLVFSPTNCWKDSFKKGKNEIFPGEKKLSLPKSHESKSHMFVFGDFSNAIISCRNKNPHQQFNANMSRLFSFGLSFMLIWKWNDINIGIKEEQNKKEELNYWKRFQIFVDSQCMCSTRSEFT